MEALPLAFASLAGEAFELPNGFTNHATMGAEALVALGLDGAVDGWTARSHLPARAPGPTGRPIGQEWWAELGDYARVGDWVEHVTARLGSEGWRAVVRDLVPVLLPGLGTHLFHGLIRTAHAVRAVEQADHPAAGRPPAPELLDELARGLAYWAARYGTGRGTLAVQAPAAPAPAPDADSGAGQDPATLDSAPLRTVLALARRAGQGFLDRPDIVQLHGITAPAAYLLVAPHLPDPAHRTAAEAFTRTHARLAPGPQGDPPRVADQAPDDLRLDVLAHARDAHPIKLVEASLRLAGLTDDPVFVACARRMTG